MGREVAVDGVVVNEDKVLLILRDHEPFAGYWVLPGGHVERNETVEQALFREIKEETGLDVGILSLIGVFSDPDRDPRGLVSVAYLISPINHRVKINREASKWSWFHWDDIPSNVGFDHRDIIKSGKTLWTNLNSK